MASDQQIIENAVKETMHEMEKRAPVQMHRLKQDKTKYQSVLRAAQEAATEQVNMAKEFANEPEDILTRLKKYLPEKRIKMIQGGLSLPTYRMDVIQCEDGSHSVKFKREEEMFLAPRKLETMADVEWSTIMQYASIVVEGVLLVLSAIGVSPSVSAGTIEKTAEEVAEALKNSSKFEAAVKAFVDAWHAAGDNKYAKAKALFYLLKNTYSAGLLWTIIKSLCSSMKWYDWLETAAKVSAMIIAAFATEGAALIAEIALVVLSAVDFARKLKNIKQLEEIKSSMS